MAYFITSRQDTIQIANPGQPPKVILPLSFLPPASYADYTAEIRVKNGPEPILVDSHDNIGLGDYGYLLGPGEEVTFKTKNPLVLYAVRTVWNLNQAYCYVTVNYDGPA